MRKKNVAVLDFGSHRLNLLLASRGVNENLVIKSLQSAVYQGYQNGKFFDESSLSGVISNLISSASKEVLTFPRTLYVGVPSDFSFVKTATASISFNNVKRITDLDVQALYDLAASKIPVDRKYLISNSALIFQLDDGRQLANAIGEKSASLSGYISFIYAKSDFFDKIKSVICEIASQVSFVEFVSAPLSKSLFLFDEKERDAGVTLIDVDYLTSSLLTCIGDGINFCQMVSFGLQPLAAKIAGILNSTPTIAYALMCSVSMFSIYSEDETLEYVKDGQIYSFKNVDIVSAIALALDDFCDSLSNIIQTNKLPSDVIIYLTGGVLEKIRGAKEYLENRLDYKLEYVTPLLPQLRDSYLCTAYSLADIALKN